MKQLWLRLISETPKFFKKIQAIGISLAALGAALQAIDGIPSKVDSIAETFIWLGPVIVVISQFAVSNTGTTPEKLTRNKI